MGCRLPSEADIGRQAPARLSLDVQDRTPAANELQFAEQGGKLAWRMLPEDRPGLPQDSAGPAIAAARAKVTEQPRAQAFRLADVDQLPVGIEHAVHAGTPRTALACPAA